MIIKKIAAPTNSPKSNDSSRALAFVSTSLEEESADELAAYIFFCILHDNINFIMKVFIQQVFGQLSPCHFYEILLQCKRHIFYVFLSCFLGNIHIIFSTQGLCTLREL